MKNIYKCSHGVDNSLPKVVEKYKFDFNLVNKSGIKMGELAERIYEEYNPIAATLPFGHTIEAQAFGSKVEFDYANGNRIVGFPEHINLPNFRDESIHMIFEAIEYLKDKDVPVRVNVSGPVSLATSISPTDEVYRGMAKNTEASEKLFSIIEDFLAEYISRIMELDIDILSYADPAGTADIIGKRLYKKIAAPSFLRVIENIRYDNNTLIHICPKSSSSLLAVDMIEEDEDGILSGGSCISAGLNSKLIKKYSVK